MAKKLHYGWLVCLGCALLLFCTSGLTVNAFTVYQPYLIERCGLTNTQSSMIVTVRSLTAFLGMLVTGVYFKKFSLRNGMGLAGLFIVLGFALFGVAREYALLLGAAVLTGIGYGLGTMIPIAIVLEHWFVRKRTLAVGICSAATGLSTLGIPNLITLVVERCGLRTAFLGEAVVIAVLCAVSRLLIRDWPADRGLQPFGAEASEEQDAAEPIGGGRGLGKAEWALLVPLFLLLGGMTSVAYSHLGVMAVQAGFDAHTTAAAIMVSGLALMGGKFLYGALSGRMTAEKSNLLFGAMATAGLLLCCCTGGRVWALMAAMLLYGSGLALTTVGLTVWAADLSRVGEYDTLIRRFQILYSAGTLVFSPLPGLLADRFDGSYTPAYLFFTVSTVLLVAGIQFIYHRAGPEAKTK